MRFPVLVKAAAGGGGKGMRVVREPADLPAAIAAARREAGAAFGDDTLLLERFVERGRHVEVQVVGDVHGTVLHLYERDCSVQRRHQKVLEEAPAPGLSPALRERLLLAGVALAREVGYTGAGTVEFLVAGEEFYFLEMNTRLQVEHPVTEAVTGLDIVTLQLQVAAGRPLGLAQEQVRCVGHAMEARVYAEDPYAGFLPQAGRASLVHWPARARVDEALESGQEVGTAYDPMLAKVIVHGPDRAAARAALVRALDQTAVLGLTTNLGFCRDLADSAAFAAGDVHTAWLDRDPAAAALLDPPTAPSDVAPVAAWLLARHLARPSDHPFASGDGWRSAGPAAPVVVRLSQPVSSGSASAGVTTWRVDPGAEMVEAVEASSAAHPDEQTGSTRRPAWHLRPLAGGIGESVHRFEVADVVPAGGAHARAGSDGQPRGRTVEVAALVDDSRVELGWHGHVWRLRVPDPLAAGAEAGLGDGVVRAPMPGTVLALDVRAGDAVTAGQTVAVLEAMKMELALTAGHDGVVSDVGVGVGDQVPLGAALVVVTPVVREAEDRTGGES